MASGLCVSWALGEAVVDAVVTRYPAAFDRQALDES